MSLVFPQRVDRLGDLLPLAFAEAADLVLKRLLGRGFGCCGLGQGYPVAFADDLHVLAACESGFPQSLAL